MKLIFSNEELERIVFEGFKALYPDLEFCRLDVAFDIDAGESEISVIANYLNSPEGEKQSLPYKKKLEAQIDKENSRRENQRKLFSNSGDEDQLHREDERDSDQTFAIDIFGQSKAPF